VLRDWRIAELDFGQLTHCNIFLKNFEKEKRLPLFSSKSLRKIYKFQNNFLLCKEKATSLFLRIPII
jgi:hypothetical protein